MAKKDPEPTKPAAKPAAKADPAASTTSAATPASPSKKAQVVPIHGPDSIIDRLQPHIKEIAIGALALFLVIGGYVTWRYMRHRGEAKDTIKLSAGLDLARARVGSAADTEPKAPAPPPSKEPAFATVKERAAAAADAIAKAGGAARKNALYTASLYMDAGKLDEAEALYKDHSGDPGLDGALAREGLGYVIEARADASKDPAEQQKLYQQALDAFKQVQVDDKGPRRDYALYDQARMLQQLDKRGEAKALLDQALKIAPKSEIKSDIEARLALLEAP